MATASLGGVTVNNPLQLSNTKSQPLASSSPIPSSDNGAIFYNPSTGGGSTVQNGQVVPLPPNQIGTVPTAITMGGASGLNSTYGSSGGSNTTVASAPSPALAQSTIDAIMQTIANQVQANQDKYNTAATYNANQDAQDKLDYGHQVQGNNESRAAAIQDAEQAAASGSQGLRGVLASLGALAGTGEELAGRAVADSANNDIGTADKTYQTNATAIQNAQTGYENSAAKRDADLKTALADDNQNAHASGIQQILNAAQNLGDTATYNKFLPQLVQATTPPTPLTGTQTTYNPASVNQFAPPSGLTVSSAPSTNSAAAKASTTPVNSALYVKKTS